MRSFGPQAVIPVFKNLKMVSISHMHADHYLGFINLFIHWRKVNTVGEKLAVVCPRPFITWITDYANVEDIGVEFIDFFDCKNLDYRGPTLE